MHATLPRHGKDRKEAKRIQTTIKAIVSTTLKAASIHPDFTGMGPENGCGSKSKNI
jgi:hypothetical protein